MNIEQGQLWQVTTTCFHTSGNHNEFKRPVSLIKGEIIEIRYPYAWHFRAEDDNYFHATPDMILKNAVHIGTIWENVSFGNKCKLKTILDCELHSREKAFVYKERN